MKNILYKTKRKLLFCLLVLRVMAIIIGVGFEILGYIVFLAIFIIIFYLETHTK